MTRREGTSPPYGYRIVLNRENTALASLERYLELVSHLVKEANVDTLGQSLSLLENRARRARSDIIIWSLVSRHRQNIARAPGRKQGEGARQLARGPGQ